MTAFYVMLAFVVGMSFGSAETMKDMESVSQPTEQTDKR